MVDVTAIDKLTESLHRTIRKRSKILDSYFAKLGFAVGLE